MARHVLWGTFDTGKPRVRMMVAAMRAMDPALTVCHRSPWTGIEDKTQVRGLVAWLRLALRWAFAYPVLIVQYLRSPAHDIVVVPYPGNLDVLLIWPFARLRGARVCWDMFISAYDTVAIDRALIRRRGVVARLLYAAEWLSARAADRILLDTQAHGRYIADLYHVPAHKIRAVWVGVEDQVFTRAADPPPAGDLRVLFYGQFIPLHGLDTIVQAIADIRKRPQSPAIHFTIVGSGQEAPRIDHMIADLGLTGIERIAWVPYEKLPALIQRSSVCLGVFSGLGKGGRVIPNKVFQILACGRPLVTMDSPAMREIVSPGLAIRLVRPGDAAHLADTLIQLAHDMQRPGGAEAIHASAALSMPVADADVIRVQMQQALDGM